MIVETLAPSLTRICLDLLKDKNKVERLFKKMNDIASDESFTLFMDMFSKGFCTKTFLKMLFDDIPGLSDRSFYRCLIDYKFHNLITFVGQLDEEKKIFTTSFLSWYYIPLFIFDATELEANSNFDNILPDDTLIQYNLKRENIFISSWIFPLLYLCCNNYTVKKDEKGKIYLGSLTRVEMKILLDKYSLKILYTGYQEEFLQVFGRDIMVKGLKEFIKNHLILKEYINAKQIRKINL